jgi:cobaltochelatase CobT
MSSTKPARRDKLQQQVEELCGASIRAMSGQTGFRFRSRAPEVNGKSTGIRAPHLQPDLVRDNFVAFRGAADGIALRLQHSDQPLHQKMMPEHAVGQVIFELLEQLRVESLVSKLHPGAKANIVKRYRQWCSDFCQSKMIENHVGLLVYTIAQVVWARLSGLPVNEATEGLIEPQRMMLAPHIGTYLVGLRKNTTNQLKYGENVLGIVNVIDEIVTAMDGKASDKPKKEDDDDTAQNFGLIQYPPAIGEGEIAASVASNSRNNYQELMSSLASYQVYSKDNDRVVHAQKLILPAQLIKLRKEQDQLIAGQGLNVPRLARDFTKVLTAPMLDGWEFGLQDGYIDARMLNKLVTSPNYRDLYRQEKTKPKSNCLVTFLLDNSGSMKQHIAPIAMLIETMTKALELAGAKTEILGFTTRVWQGGKTFKQWRSRGAKANPGRLTELEHIIYKDANTPFKRARLNIAAMLKPELFREGIDGEALLWASQRMENSPEQRRIIIVLSDGSPMESATSQNNPAEYLDHHLCQVSAMLEAKGDIELYALGFGLDLSRYYRHNIALDLPQRLENKIFNEVLRMLSSRR